MGCMLAFEEGQHEARYLQETEDQEISGATRILTVLAGVMFVAMCVPYISAVNRTAIDDMASAEVNEVQIMVYIGMMVLPCVAVVAEITHRRMFPVCEGLFHSREGVFYLYLALGCYAMAGKLLAQGRWHAPSAALRRQKWEGFGL